MQQILHGSGLAVLVGVLGLLVGSFLNVVIYRLPRMLESSWVGEAHQILGIAQPNPQEKLTLNWPASHCPSCQKRLPAWCNIPLLSFGLLHGRCYFCQVRIPFTYPLVESLSALLSLLAALRFGFTPILCPILLLIWGLITLSAIDARHQLLPDSLVLPLLWLGLLLNHSSHALTSAVAAIWGCTFGYLSFWGLNALFRWLRGQDGLGGGDCKLLALWGAWLGWSALPLIMVAAGVLALIMAAAVYLKKGCIHNVRLPFGPSLAMAGLSLLLSPNTVSSLL